ncbi:Ferric siderophore transport system, periplasmic binding protein TonB [hydrothermal vent metagenome]|uniref:Ferric siderophore transport system, periplasmic binding protein TonB n=1 Tax=hydrothermal vent metagenome TaxID=652676 RepID=A0A3B0XIE4_9ZZZZ
MPFASYEQLALRWRPEGRSDFNFKIITAIVVSVLFLVAVVLSSIDVPDKKREARHVVPERIANFILEKKEKPKPKIEKPKPKPEPRPKPKPKPKVKKIVEKKINKKPLTKTQKKARKKAADSGLLALGNELADLMDTDDVSSMVGGKVKASSAAASRAGSNNKALLMADAGKGSGGVNASDYASGVGSTRLSQQELTQVRQSLISPAAERSAKDAKRRKKSRTGGVRSEESVAMVFEQNKGKLHSIYNRERRKDPTIKGRIVLEITISPSGKVSRVKIVSSELNNKNLERRLISRIKRFKFGAMKVETVTVTYPIDFLPS